MNHGSYAGESVPIVRVPGAVSVEALRGAGVGGLAGLLGLAAVVRRAVSAPPRPRGAGSGSEEQRDGQDQGRAERRRRMRHRRAMPPPAARRDRQPAAWLTRDLATRCIGRLAFRQWPSNTPCWSRCSEQPGVRAGPGPALRAVDRLLLARHAPADLPRPRPDGRRRLGRRRAGRPVRAARTRRSTPSPRPAAQVLADWLADAHADGAAALASSR